MSSVEFDEIPAYTIRSSQTNTATSGSLIEKAIQLGLAKDRKGAVTLFVGILIVSVIIAISIPLLISGKVGHDPSPSELKQYINLMHQVPAGQ